VIANIDQSTFGYIKTSEQYQVLLDCQSFVRTDMMFYYIYRLIARYDLLPNHIPINRDELTDRFSYFTSSLLLDKMGVELGNSTPSYYGWPVHYEQYSKETDRLRSSFINYLIEYPSKAARIGIDLDEYAIAQTKISEQFQILMIMGYQVAKQRFERTVNSDNIIGAEIHGYSNTELILFPTLMGMIEMDEFNAITSQERQNLFYKSLKELGLHPVNNQPAQKILKSSLLVVHNGALYSHYLTKGDHSSEYISKRNNRHPISNYRVEFQTNLREFTSNN
jgi:hypothetical protein